MRSRRLGRIADLAERRLRIAAEALRSTGEALRERERQLAQLNTYREEYARLLVATGQAGVSAKALKDFRVFLARLDHAIAQSARSVDLARERARRDARIWQTARTRLQALNNAVARHRSRERQQGLRGEQRELDEHVARRAALGSK